MRPSTKSPSYSVIGRARTSGQFISGSYLGLFDCVSGLSRYSRRKRVIPAAGCRAAREPYQAGEDARREFVHAQGRAPDAGERMVRLYEACPRDRTTEPCEAAIGMRTILPGQARLAAQGSGPGHSAVSLPNRTRVTIAARLNTHVDRVASVVPGERIP
jgi:hypothetical protein